MTQTQRSPSLNYTIKGNGSPIVMLHGFMESKIIWKRLSERLQSSNRIIVIDLPGHGNSPELKSDFSIDHMARSVYSLLRSLGISQAIFIGHSMGGYVGLALNDLYPESVDKLILLHSKAEGDTKETKLKRDVGIEMLQRHPSLFIQESIKNLFWPSSIERLSIEIKSLISDALSTDYKGYIQALIAMKERPDRLSQLAEKENIFYIAGKHDPVIPFSVSLSEMTHLNIKRTAILENSGHMGFLEEKEKCEQLIVDFINTKV
jgi:pimeloyl-ACP methyl ester carboxylesterase